MHFFFFYRVIFIICIILTAKCLRYSFVIDIEILKKIMIISTGDFCDNDQWFVELMDFKVNIFMMMMMMMKLSGFL